MKKLVIFLIPLIVSISAYAKEKSSFTENFSLIKYSEANNRKVFEIDIFSERTPLSRIATVENRNQKRGNRYNLIYELQEDINSEKKSESLAERYLRRLAERNKKSRKTGSITYLAGGGVSLGLGVWMMSLEEEEFNFGKLFGVAFIIYGAAFVGAGIYSLAIPSGAERKFANVLSISDPAQRERASHEALSSLAARGKKRRIITSAVIAGLGVYFSLRDKESSSAVVFGGVSAAYYFLTKTRAERTYQNYLREKEYRKELALRIGIMPYGGVKIGFLYSF